MKQNLIFLCNKIQEIVPKVKRIRLIQDPMNPFF